MSDSESIRSSLPLDQMPGALSLLQVLSVSKGRNGIGWLEVAVIGQCTQLINL